MSSGEKSALEVIWSYQEILGGGLMLPGANDTPVPILDGVVSQGENYELAVFIVPLLPLLTDIRGVLSLAQPRVIDALRLVPRSKSRAVQWFRRLRRIHTVVRNMTSRKKKLLAAALMLYSNLDHDMDIVAL
ncbi:hypothetical protein J6590_039667 [Homalodisca vitripennis]|nr:hypothetical protein J6590_039667 [Homalodisca vitripennis]